MVTVVFDTTNPPGIEADDLLAENQVYTLQIDGTAQDLAGNALTLESISWTTQADVTEPQVASTLPSLANVLSAATTSNLVVTFDENMDQTFGLVDVESRFGVDERSAGIGSAGADLSIVWNNATDLQINFDSPLLTNTFYEIVLFVDDVAGNNFDDRQELYLVTAGTDSGSPSVMSTVPPAGATGVNPDSLAFLSFSRPMGPDIFDHIRVSGNGSTAYVLERVISPTGIIVIPKQAWPGSSAITVTALAGATDASGNTLASPFSFTFTTGAHTTSSWGLDDP